MLTLATATGLRGDQASWIIQVAFLAPDLADRILCGDHPPGLTATRLVSLVPLPTDWAA